MQVLTISEIEDVSGGGIVAAVGGAVVTAGSASIGAYYGAQVGAWGGPIGLIVGAGAAYAYYNYFL